VAPLQQRDVLQALDSQLIQALLSGGQLLGQLGAVRIVRIVRDLGYNLQ
jgi:hypothetical protein